MTDVWGGIIIRAYADDSEVVKVIDVPGTAESGAGYISVNEEITAASGKRRVILNGLKAGKSAKLKIKNGTVVKWSSSNDKIVTVKDGKVKGVKKGTSKVTATLYSGRKLTCKVTVK